MQSLTRLLLLLSSIPESEEPWSSYSALAPSDASRINNYLMEKKPGILKSVLMGMLSYHAQNPADAPQILTRLAVGMIPQTRFSLSNYLTPSSSNYNRLIDRLRLSYNDQLSSNAGRTIDNNRL